MVDHTIKWQISQIPEGEPSERAFDESDSATRHWVGELKKDGLELSPPYRFELQLTKLEPNYFVRGTLDVTVGNVCARCAESFSLPIHHTFELALVHHVGTAAELEEKSSADPDSTFFLGPEIDVGKLLEEQLVLSLPYRALCTPECKGICQHCGQNLNTGTCACEAPNLSPFAALKGLSVKTAPGKAKPRP